MNKKTVLSIVLGALALIGACVGVLLVLKRKGVLKLKKTSYDYEEEFPEETAEEQRPAEAPVSE